jgi:hypothetical protein
MKWTMTMLIAAYVMAAFTITTFAEDQVEFTLSTDLYDKYIWRGQNINDDAVLQPAFGATYKGLTASVWGNLDLTDDSQTAPDNAGEFSEFDYTLDYSFDLPEIDWLSFSVGAIYYRFPNTPYSPTTELYSGVSLSSVPLAPSIKLYRDVDEIDGSYVQLGLGHTFEKVVEWNEKCYCGLQLGASLGWGDAAYNDGYFGVDKDRLNDMTLSGGLCVQIYDWMIKPSLNYATILDDDIRSGRENNDNLWLGIGIATSF